MQTQHDDRHKAENPKAVIGDNSPPGPIDDARAVYQTIAAFMREMPVVESEVDALAANEKLTVGRSMLKSLETTRDAEADPIYAAWKAARDRYKPALDSLTKLTGELAERVAAFMRAEEARREAKAEEARRVAAELERRAREAEAAELEARENAAVGEIVDVGAAIDHADEAFAEFKLADRVAAVAEKDSRVRFKSRFGAKATTLRTKETLTVSDAMAALGEVGITDKIKEAILSEARAFRKAHGRLPNGVVAQTERTL